ncbi:uncharacterized protein Fot_03610 [Forsythia ovata]|uniref:Uncharacterized protein n=1 Tax=Forsythia ovata TaxID=205694 RepID=A0ABD1XA77_9LAMI
MVLGSMDSGARGNSSSSASNLSALAPPFTVHRSNPKHNSSTFLHYTEPPYAAELVSQSWQSPHPSPPRPELNIDSTLTTSTRPVKDYQFLASTAISPPGARWSVLSPGAGNSKDAFSFAGEFKPYYTPYLSTVVGEELPLVVDNGPSYDMMPANGLGVSSLVDDTQSLSSFEYTQLWDDG